MLSDAIGSRWYFYVTEQLGLLNVGTVEVRFVVRENKCRARCRCSATVQTSFAACTVRAIMEADIPQFQNLSLCSKAAVSEIEYSFTILSN